ncbi:MAG TPA: PhoH family protein, partial [Stellaceae bacterium]|nr:PhoH family protein [Stellaceae bacterium]
MGKRSPHVSSVIRFAAADHAACIAVDRIEADNCEGEREQRYRRKVRPQSDGQRRLMTAIEHHNLTVALGPAGSGKTYLAVS